MLVAGRLKSFITSGLLLVAGFAWGEPSDLAWRSYRSGPARTAYIDEPLPSKLQLLWTFDSGTPPQPAWPAPARQSYWQQLESIAPRVTDDWAFQPLVVSNRVLFGSSGDDHIYCLQGETGDLLWRFGTDGPVRYAPVVHDDRVFVGSDDGRLYCLDLEAGTLIWQRALWEEDLRIPGNGRIVSSWPVRTGCLVVKDRVFIANGLYPQQGAWLHALETKTGDTVWKSPLDVSPQGYLLASEREVFVPTGRSQPVAFDLAMGGKLRTMTSLGGTFAVVSEGDLFGGRGNDGSLGAVDVETGGRLAAFKGSQMAVGPEVSVLYDSENLVRVDRTAFSESLREMKRWNMRLQELQARLRRSGAEAVSREDREQRKDASRRLAAAELRHEASTRVLRSLSSCHSLIMVRGSVVVGGDDGVSAFSLDSGELLWNVSTPEPVLGLAYSGECLVASGQSGRLYGWGVGEEESVVRQTVVKKFPPVERTSELRARAISVLEQIRIQKGYVVLLGTAAGDLVDLLTSESGLKGVVFLKDENDVRARRDEKWRRGTYGNRIAIHQLGESRLPLTDGFAALVINGFSDELADEARRIVRPHGGLLWSLSDDSVGEKAEQAGEGEWTHLYGNAANTACSGDELVAGDVALQWFGGVGPRRMVDRHLRGSAPLYARGIMVVPGENVVIGVDAYTGEELWERSLPSSQRYSMPFDAGYMSLSKNRLAVAVQSECWLIDTLSGNVQRKLPLSSVSEESHWGYVVLDGERIIGSAQSVHASRTEPSRSLIDSDYRNVQPIVCSQAVFSVDAETGNEHWRYGERRILNPTLTVSGDSLYFVELDAWASDGHDAARIRLDKLPERRASLVCLDRKFGVPRWAVPLPEDLLRSRNILYLAAARDRLVALGSWLNARNDTTYAVACFSIQDGTLLWEAEHDKGKPGQTYHGEQMHHPVIMGDTLIAEPALYELSTGRRMSGAGAKSQWMLDRPGHSCGTLSASRENIFFRAGNPTYLELEKHLAGEAEPTKLSPSRPGCWINIIPAGGLVLIPEASSGCVCDFSLQTSMAFRPRRARP